jgi:hypothetical protein
MLLFTFMYFSPRNIYPSLTNMIILVFLYLLLNYYVHNDAKLMFDLIQDYIHIRIYEYVYIYLGIFPLGAIFSIIAIYNKCGMILINYYRYVKISMNINVYVGICIYICIYYVYIDIFLYLSYTYMHI